MFTNTYKMIACGSHFVGTCMYYVIYVVYISYTVQYTSNILPIISYNSLGNLASTLTWVCKSPMKPNICAAAAACNAQDGRLTCAACGCHSSRNVRQPAHLRAGWDPAVELPHELVVHGILDHIQRLGGLGRARDQS